MGIPNFRIFSPNKECGNSLEPPNVYPQSVWSKNKKNIKFSTTNFKFLQLRKTCILHERVFLLMILTRLCSAVFFLSLIIVSTKIIITVCIQIVIKFYNLNSGFSFNEILQVTTVPPPPVGPTLEHLPVAHQAHCWFRTGRYYFKCFFIICIEEVSKCTRVISLPLLICQFSHRTACGVSKFGI